MSRKRPAAAPTPALSPPSPNRPEPHHTPGHAGCDACTAREPTHPDTPPVWTHPRRRPCRRLHDPDPAQRYYCTRRDPHRPAIARANLDAADPGHRFP
ncbi:hypothetical protein HYPSUDRAFT_72824 [Hypholoma sublateritium FD-334 SS-4]|uniref:Uncharacterized protein n=1 Tax=Hypholoma sublateritium (strain FD-334 SS-4) TaxID=945553 RepID=A0A0D2N3T3_HYPSF|nr:hypothetical protein HYPSUDRAFT_72824 [Hypholoma sublateritium FD-334 SS-4]